MDILTAGRTGASLDEYVPEGEHLSVAWLGTRHEWLDFAGARAAFDDVDLSFAAASSSPLAFLPESEAMPDVFHLVDSQTVSVSRLRAAAPESGIVLDLSRGTPRGRRSHRLVARQIAAADLVVVGSRVELRETRRRLPQWAERIVCLDSPLDLDRHAPPAALRERSRHFESFRQAKGLDRPALLYAGPYTPRGGLDAAVVAAAAVLPRVPDVVLAAIRHGEVDNGYLKRCAKRAAALGVRTIIEDAPSPDELALWYAAAHVVCLPSRDGAGGEPARLAAAAARPVVGSEVDSLLERVIDGETGHLVPVDDHLALTAAITILLTDEQEAARLGAAARQQIESEAAPSTVAARLRRFWDTAIRRRRGDGSAGGGPR